MSDLFTIDAAFFFPEHQTSEDIIIFFLFEVETRSLSVSIFTSKRKK